MNYLYLNLSQVRDSINELKSIKKAVSMASNYPVKGLLDGFSTVSGLDHMGRYHGQALDGAAGSAKEMLEAFERQIDWLEHNLQACYDANVEINQFVTEDIYAIEHSGTPEYTPVVFPTRPELGFAPFDFPEPITSKAASLESLQEALLATNNAAAIEAADIWTDISNRVMDISARLRRVAGDLAEHNYGEVFEAAASRIHEMSATGINFATNADVMATSVRHLSTIAPAYAQSVAGALASVHVVGAHPSAIAMKKQLEETYLVGFKEALGSTLVSSMPGVRNLMDAPEIGSGGGSTGGFTSPGHTGGGITRSGHTAQNMGIDPHLQAHKVLDDIA
ncbi:hypothetical protein P4N68_13230, partial [Corynebacterium felinum]